MLSVYQLKTRFQRILRPGVRIIAPHVTANQVTVVAALGSVAYAIALAGYPAEQGLWLGMPLVLLGRMALNAVDGMLAREHNQKSILGGLLNEVGDVLSDTSLFLALLLVAGPAWGWWLGATLLAVLTEFVGVCAWALTGDRRYDGPMGKSDRAVVLGATGLLVGLGLKPADVLQWLAPGVCLALVFTVAIRARHVTQRGS